MDAQQIIALVLVGGAAAWLAWKYVFSRKKGCGCGDGCSAKTPLSKESAAGDDARKP